MSECAKSTGVSRNRLWAAVKGGYLKVVDRVHGIPLLDLAAVRRYLKNPPKRGPKGKR